jgi:NADH dehydrogenase FAD-containing subunit
VQCGTFATVFVRGILYPYVLVVPADNPLPPLAQVAEQQGKYLAHILNEEAAHMNPWQGGQGSPAASKQVGGAQRDFAGKAAAGEWVTCYTPHGGSGH